MTTLGTLQIIERFRPALGDLGHLCIAGGAVRDELLGRTPKDYDLFVLWPGPWSYGDAKQAISGALSFAGFEPADPELEWHQSEPFLVQNVLVEGHRVQVMANPLRRGFRFSERFKMVLRREDVVDLSRKVVAAAELAEANERLRDQDVAF